MERPHKIPAGTVQPRGKKKRREMQATKAPPSVSNGGEKREEKRSSRARYADACKSKNKHTKKQPDHLVGSISIVCLPTKTSLGSSLYLFPHASESSQGKAIQSMIYYKVSIFLLFFRHSISLSPCFFFSANGREVGNDNANEIWGGGRENERALQKREDVRKRDGTPHPRSPTHPALIIIHRTSIDRFSRDIRKTPVSRVHSSPRHQKMQQKLEALQEEEESKTPWPCSTEICSRRKETPQPA